MSEPAAAPFVFDVDEETFEQRVLERSHEVPVLVDFWAEWCGPCRTLGPILEDLAAQAAGRWLLAKLDTDANPRLSAAFGIRGIPNVKAFRDGKLADEFTGALPRDQIEGFLAGLVPSAADEAVLAAEQQVASGDLAGARERVQAVLGDEPGHDAARLLLAEVAYAEGNREEAEAHLGQLVEAGPLAERVRTLAARLRLQTPDAAPLAELEARVAADPADLGAQLALGKAAVQAGDHDRAAEALLAVLARDSGFGDGEARQVFVDMLALMGDDDPRTDPLRRKLASLLFA